MALKSLKCTGRITNKGELDIIEKGFCYSSTVTYPTIQDADVWIVSGDLLPNDYFMDTITGLTQSTVYFINSYAINSKGTSYSSLDTTIKVTTGGIGIFPTITVNIMNNNGSSQTVYEMGSSNMLVVSGMTIKNDETIFNNGYLNQTSSPPPLNPIKSWSGYQSTYNTSVAPTVSVNFLPRALDTSSWSMKQEAYYNCGNPSYVISASTTIDAVFPFLWVLKSSYQSNPFYFNPGGIAGNNYFYYEASATPIPTTPFNGKLIEKKGDKTFLVTPNNANHKYLILGFPSYYGNIKYKVESGSWTIPSYFNTTSVGTGNSVSTPYVYNYNILQYNFLSYSSKPIEFSIMFI